MLEVFLKWWYPQIIQVIDDQFSIEIHDDLRILRDLRTPHISWPVPEAPLETFGTKVLCRGSPRNQKKPTGEIAIGICSVDVE